MLGWLWLLVNHKAQYIPLSCLQDGAVSEDEARFFLSGNDNFDLDTFKQIGFVLVKPYLDLEGVTDAPAADEELVAPPTEEFTPPPPENPEVYDPWRKNQAAEEVSEPT